MARLLKALSLLAAELAVEWVPVAGTLLVRPPAVPFLLPFLLPVLLPVLLPSLLIPVHALASLPPFPLPLLRTNQPPNCPLVLRSAAARLLVGDVPLPPAFAGGGAEPGLDSLGPRCRHCHLSPVHARDRGPAAPPPGRHDYGRRPSNLPTSQPFDPAPRPEGSCASPRALICSRTPLPACLPLGFTAPALRPLRPVWPALRGRSTHWSTAPRRGGACGRADVRKGGREKGDGGLK